MSECVGKVKAFSTTNKSKNDNNIIWKRLATQAQDQDIALTFLSLIALRFTMALAENLGFLALILIVTVVIAVHYLLTRKTQGKLWKVYSEALREQETFLKAFSSSPFEDFSLFDFRVGRFSFSYVSPFPKQVEGEWRYGICLGHSEAEDVSTITHEISECTIGRVIERLLNLETPLYLQRKEANRFWIHRKKQKYHVEHIMVTLGELDELTFEKLSERLNKEDIEAWLN